MADDKLSGKAGLDTTNFKTGIAEMNRELRVLESGFRASAAGLADWANDATGLETRIKSLSAQMEIQERKVAATRAEYERMKAEKGENSRAAQDLEIKLNKEVETLGKMGSELRETEGALNDMESGTDDAGESVDEMGDQMDDSGSKAETFKGIMAGVGAVMGGLVTVIAAVGAAAVAAVGAIIALVFTAANAAADIADMSAKTGISTTRLQELDFIAGQTGTSLDTITGANARLIRSMGSAQDEVANYQKKLADAQAAGKSFDDIELGGVAKAFADLGIPVTSTTGELRNSQDVFNNVIDKLGQIKNPAERDALAMEIFGKSAQELNPLIKTGSAEMAKMAAQAHEVGAVMDDETVASLEAFDDTLASLQAGLKGTLGTLASAFLPGFQLVFDQLGGYLKEFAGIVKGSNGDFGKIAEGLTGLITKIVADIGKQAPQLLEAGLSIVKSIITAILTALPGLLDAAINIITTLIDFLVQNLPLLIDAAIQIITTLVQGILPQLPRLVDAALQIIVTLANGIAEMLPTLIPTIVQVIIQIVQTLIDNLPVLINAALRMIIALADGLVTALPTLIAAIPVLIDALLVAILASMPQLFTAAGKLIGELAKGIVASIPVVIFAIGDLIVRIGTTIGDFVTNVVPDLGRSFISGLVDGITSGAGMLYDAVADIVNTMIANIMNLLGISSPSKVGRAIGRNFFESQGLGAMDALRNVEKTFALVMQQLTGSMAGSANGAGGVGLGGSSISNSEQIGPFFAPVIIQGETTPGSLGAALKGKRY